jgi:salicylate hydroxylase
MAEDKPKLKIALVGGGTVGLTLALYLNQLGTCDVSVYEATAVFSTIGAGIDLGMCVLHNLIRVSAQLCQVTMR